MKIKEGMTVLVVDDQYTYRELAAFSIESELGIPYHQVLQAGTLDEARMHFANNKEIIMAVCLDGCVDSYDELDSIPLITEFAGEGRLIVAMSSSDIYRCEMMKAGCTHESSSKRSVGAVLKRAFAEKE